MFKVLQPLFDMEGEIGSAQEVPTPPSVEGEGQEPSANGSAPEPEDKGTEIQSPEDVSKQESFAKRLKESTEKALAEEREKWEKENSEKYKDYDVSKKALEYLMKTSNINDPLTLKEQIELTELQERADQQNVPAEVLKRIDELEAKASRADEMEAQQKQQQEWQQFEQTLKDFCGDKEIDGQKVDHMELWKFMHENGVSKPDVALKAMKAEHLEKQLENAEKTAVEKYLASKKAPKAEGSPGAAGSQSVDTSKLGWNDVEKVAAERIRASRQPT